MVSMGTTDTEGPAPATAVTTVVDDRRLEVPEVAEVAVIADGGAELLADCEGVAISNQNLEFVALLPLSV